MMKFDFLSSCWSVGNNFSFLARSLQLVLPLFSSNGLLWIGYSLQQTETHTFQELSPQYYPSGLCNNYYPSTIPPKLLPSFSFLLLQEQTDGPGHMPARIRLSRRYLSSHQQPLELSCTMVLLLSYWYLQVL